MSLWNLALGLRPDSLFMLDAIDWLKYLVASFFFSLGLFAGWWQWHYRRLLLRLRDGAVAQPARLHLAPPSSKITQSTPPAEETRAGEQAAGGEAAIDEPEADEPAVAQADPFGPIYTTAPGEVDALEQIWGIGRASRLRLNRLGIYQFKQIANWGAPEIAAISKELCLGDQIDRFRWVEQAKSFEKPPSAKAD